MTLLGTQIEFAYLLGRLLQHIPEMGLSCSVGDVQRSVEEQKRLIAAGLSHVHDPARGTHVLKLAADINLFSGHHFLQTVADYQPLGEWWEWQHSLARWGGHFDDARHFSFEWGGVRAGGPWETRC